jgi:hypothetical protein
MAFDYVLKFPCNVRQAVPEQKLAALVGYRSLAQFAFDEARRAEPALSPEAILAKYQVEVSQTRPDGIVKQVPMTIGQLVEMARPLVQYQALCSDCRANVADRAFGCIAKINYPIRRESEQWLLSRLPADAANPGLALLFDFLSDVGIDGRNVDELRPRLFESKTPLVRRWGDAPDQKQLSSSQLIHMLVFSGELKPLHAEFYTKVLGLTSVLSDPHPPSANIEQFKTLMCAIVMAGRLQAPIATEP